MGHTVRLHLVACGDVVLDEDWEAVEGSILVSEVHRVLDEE